MDKRKRMQRVVRLGVFVLLLASCGGSKSKQPGIPTPLVTATPVVAAATSTPATETFEQGEPVTFYIDDTVTICTNDLPYKIIQITDGGEREVMLQHSCLGEAGTGVDQTCKDGQIESVEVGSCSDAILCEETKIRQTVTWDQQEYVKLTEQCAGKTILHEEKQQVAPGRYQVIVQYMQNDQISTRIIKELSITSN